MLEGEEVWDDQGMGTRTDFLANPFKRRRRRRTSCFETAIKMESIKSSEKGEFEIGNRLTE